MSKKHPTKRTLLLEAANYKCERCGHDLLKPRESRRKNPKKRRFVFHHIIDKKYGGTNKSSNLLVSCINCERAYHKMQDNATITQRMSMLKKAAILIESRKIKCKWLGLE